MTSIPFSDANKVVQDDLDAIISNSLPWNQLALQTVIVAGGGGLLGSYLVKSLLCATQRYDLQLQVICVARNQHNVQHRLGSFIKDPRLRVIFHDVSNPLPDSFPPANIVIHSASQASPKYYGIDPVGTLLANTAGSIHLLNHSVAHNSARFLFFSSGEVYGIPINPQDSIKEEDYGYLDPIKVRSCYAESKRIGETMCAAWSHQYGLHTSVVRPFHTYGPGMALDDGRVFADFVADVVYGRDIVIKSDGLAKRPFCYIADATLGFLTVLLKGSSGEAYNVANPSTEISMRDLANTIAALYPDRGIGVSVEPSSSSNSYLRSPILQSCPSIAKISELGWQPKIGIEEGFRRTIDSYIK